MPRKASSKPKEHLTSTTVEKLPIPASGQRFYYDLELSGFAIRVTATGTRAFVIDCFKRGKRIRYTIGKCELYSVTEARNQARVLLGKIQTGENPHAMRREKMARAVTLEEAFEAFLEARKNLAPRTVYDYRRLMNTHLAKWKNKALVDITKDMIERRHAELGVSSGKAQANYTMRFVRAVFNFAMVKYESSNGEAMIAVNPVKRLSQMRAWYHIDRRTGYIKPHQLKPWFESVLGLSNRAAIGFPETVRDYLVFLLLTGLRRGEGARLKWAQVDLQGGSFTVLDTKNRRPHTLPLSDYLLEMLVRRKGEAVNEFVFPGDRDGYLIEPRRQMEKVIAQSGVPFVLNDLRRTFATVVNNLERTLSYYSIKRLLNHKTQDVTAGYIQVDVESLREPMQQVTDYILKAAGVKETAPVIRVRRDRPKGFTPGIP